MSRSLRRVTSESRPETRTADSDTRRSSSARSASDFFNSLMRRAFSFSRCCKRTAAPCKDSATSEGVLASVGVGLADDAARQRQQYNLVSRQAMVMSHRNQKKRYSCRWPSCSPYCGPRNCCWCCLAIHSDQQAMANPASPKLPDSRRERPFDKSSKTVSRGSSNDYLTHDIL